MKQTLGNLIIVAVLLMAGIGSVLGATVIDDPDQLVGAFHSQWIEMLDDDRLMERVDGVDVIPDKGLGEYYIFFGKYVTDGMVFGAYVDTDNGTSTWPGYETFCQGRIDRDVFTDDDDSPDDVFAIYDPDGGQFASLENSVLTFDDNVSVWNNESIEYGGVIGGFTDMSFDDYSGTAFLDSIVLVTPPVELVSPENASSGIDPNSSLVWEGDDASEFNVHLYDDQGGPVLVFPDLTEESLDVSSYLDWNTTYNWQVDEVIDGEVTYSSPVWTFTTIDYECQNDIPGDVNGDCIFDLTDFAMMAGSWLVESQKIPKGSGG